VAKPGPSRRLNDTSARPSRVGGKTESQQLDWSRGIKGRRKARTLNGASIPRNEEFWSDLDTRSMKTSTSHLRHKGKNSQKSE